MKLLSSSTYDSHHTLFIDVILAYIVPLLIRKEWLASKLGFDLIRKKKNALR